MAKEPKDIEDQGPIGALPDGGINIGTPEEMKAKWDRAKIEEMAEQNGDYAHELLLAMSDDDEDEDEDEDDDLSDIEDILEGIE